MSFSFCFSVNLFHTRLTFYKYRLLNVVSDVSADSVLFIIPKVFRHKTRHFGSVRRSFNKFPTTDCTAASPQTKAFPTLHPEISFLTTHLLSDQYLSFDLSLWGMYTPYSSLSFHLVPIESGHSYPWSLCDD